MDEVLGQAILTSITSSWVAIMVTTTNSVEPFDGWRYQDRTYFDDRMKMQGTT